MNTHTPGPWTIAATHEIGGPFDSDGIGGARYWHSRVIRGGENGGDYIADVSLHSDGSNDYSEANANAALIAAAPELREACKALADYVANLEGGNGAMYGIVTAARAAIAKAQPEEPTR